MSNGMEAEDSNGKETTSISRLPADVCCSVILFFLALDDMCRLSLVSHTWDEFVRFHPIWRYVFMKRSEALFYKAIREHPEAAASTSLYSPFDWKMHVAKIRKEWFGQVTPFPVDDEKKSSSGRGWMWSALQYVMPQRQRKMLLTGLDNAGKKTINFLLGNELREKLVAFEKFDCTSYSCATWSIPRKVWERLDRNCFSAVIFVVDSTERLRLGECRDALIQIVKHYSTLPLLVLCNKRDRDCSTPLEEMVDALQLPTLNVPWCASGISVVKRMGLSQAFSWLLQTVENEGARKSRWFSLH